MFKLAFRSLIEKKIRFALTTLSVVLGVMFVVGVFGLTDSLRSTFSNLAENIASGTDLTVRVTQDVGNDIDRSPISKDVADKIALLEGVDEVLPRVASINVVIINDDGTPILPIGNGPPSFGFSFTPNQFFIIDGQGREPDGPDEFAVDFDTATKNGLKLGTVYQINGPNTVADFKLVGVFNFGSPDTNSSLGQTMAAFDLATAQDFLGFEDQFWVIDVLVVPDANPADVRSRIESSLNPTVSESEELFYEVITPQEATDERAAEFNQVINIFSTVLLTFAFITVFVSAFIINNTFQIVLNQRVREIGLWRAIGATPRQVSWSIVTESAIVGALSTGIGMVLGIGLTFALRALLRNFGFSLPSGPIELRPRTILLAVFVGFGVTIAASIIPALRARRISPIAALGQDSNVSESGLRRRLIIGCVMIFVGLQGLAAGLFIGLDTQLTLVLIGVGAPLTFVGINIVSPAFARPIANLLGRPVRAWFGMSGRIASSNAARDPRRTASTAGALMIGLALMGLTAVVGASIQKTFIEILDNAVDADYFVQTTQGGFNPTSGFPEQLADDLEAIDEIDTVVRYRFAIEGAQVTRLGAPEDIKMTVDILAVEFQKVESHIDGDVQSGDLASADPLTSVALYTDPAADLGVDVGDTVEMMFPDNATETLTVAAIYDDPTVYGNWIIDLALWDEHFQRKDLAFVSATIAGLSSDLDTTEQAELLQQSREAIDEVLTDYPTVTARNRVEFRENQISQLDSFLLVVTVFLGLSLVVAVVGITNTLALSVFERTREIGLLRAVGMTRRQLRRVIRWEAVIVAVFGSLLGVSVGVVFGAAATIAMPESIVNDVDVPVLRLFIYVAVSAVAGLLAAILPAYRASRMNVLDAVASH